MADPKAMVAAGYDRVAVRYAALEAGHEWPRLRRLEAMLADLPPGSRVLDVGCGNGLPVLRSIAEGRAPTGVDISTVQSEAARENVLDAEVLHGDITALEFPRARFAAIVAFYVIDHLPRDEHAPLFASFARWLQPGGHLLFTTERGEDPGSVGRWLDVPMFFSQFGEERTADLLMAAGFDRVSREVESQIEGDREIDYVWFHARTRS